MVKFRVHKNDSYDLGFVLSCLECGAISNHEFDQWVFMVIDKSENELPTYFFELTDLENRVGALYETIGYVPTDGLSNSENNAIDGIAYKRGYYDQPLNYDVHISREDALKALAANPHIEDRFRETFPFIDY